jgi:hypothetical protein
LLWLDTQLGVCGHLDNLPFLTPKFLGCSPEKEKMLAISTEVLAKLGLGFQKKGLKKRMIKKRDLNKIKNIGLKLKKIEGTLFILMGGAKQ